MANDEGVDVQTRLMDLVDDIDLLADLIFVSSEVRIVRVGEDSVAFTFADIEDAAIDRVSQRVHVPAISRRRTG